MNKTKLITIALDLIKCLKEHQTARGAQILDLKKKQIALESALRACLEAPSEPEKEEKEGPKVPEVADGSEKLASREVNSKDGLSAQKEAKDVKEGPKVPKETKGSPTVNQNIPKAK